MQRCHSEIIDGRETASEAIPVTSVVEEMEASRRTEHAGLRLLRPMTQNSKLHCQCIELAAAFDNGQIALSSFSRVRHSPFAKVQWRARRWVEGGQFSFTTNASMSTSKILARA
jgi:hypothetical protein